MFERYSEKARRAIFFARYEASQFGSPYVETEHLLLGLLREDKALADALVGSHAIIESIRKQIEGHTAIREKISTSVDLPLSNECKHVLGYASEEAERLSHKHIGTEHLLLGILREENCFAAVIMRERGLQLPAVREALLRGTISARQPPSQSEPESGESSLFERYTDKARRAIFFARYEAGAFGSSFIETEHLLLGLLRENRSLANWFVGSHAVMEEIRKQIEGHTTIREKISESVDLPLSHECKRVLGYAGEEATALSHKWIGTEHLLLGILREEQSFAAGLLHERGTTLLTVREELRRPGKAPPE
jgi:ATP-dependent Clp protease ATP-binding subunit ClpA